MGGMTLVTSSWQVAPPDARRGARHCFALTRARAIPGPTREAPPRPRTNVSAAETRSPRREQKREARRRCVRCSAVAPARVELWDVVALRTIRCKYAYNGAS